MDCPGCREKLETYLDRELSSGEALQVQFHLESCGSCVGEFAFLERFSRLIKVSCLDCAPPVGLQARLRSQMA